MKTGTVASRRDTVKLKLGRAWRHLRFATSAQSHSNVDHVVFFSALFAGKWLG